MFQPVALSNRRPQIDQPDLKTTTTSGTMHISNEMLQRAQLRVGDAILIAELPVEGTGLESTMPDGSSVFYFTKGVSSNPDTKQSAIGNNITETNNKNVVSAANVYNELGGNSDAHQEFEVGEPVYGLRTNGEPVLADSPEDDQEGVDVYAYVITEKENGTVALGLEKVAGVAAAKACNPMYPLAFSGVKEKQIKGASTTAAKGAKSTAKAAPAQEVEIDDFN